MKCFITFVGGKYAYIETSDMTRNKNAVLISPSVVAAQACLSFYYHMYGSTVGSLQIYTLRGGKRKDILWKKSANQGNRWLPAQIEISEPGSFRVSKQHK